ncbi:MAG TPA: FG-GAP repeat protein, partial [Blastocatellia bacterium]|nr:FG-GAP repeat protein [Blastocatellia bacterium]
MRTILSFMRQYSLSRKLSLRMRLIGPLGLLVAAVIFASPGKARIIHTPPPPMPYLRGEIATKYLKHQGLYNSLREAVEATRYGASNRVAIDPNFTEFKMLTASDGVSGDDFGFSVAIY